MKPPYKQPPARYYLLENCEAVGPFTVEQLRAMFASGRVHAGSQVCWGRSQEWVLATTLNLLPLPTPTKRPRVIIALVALLALLVVIIPTNELFKGKARLAETMGEFQQLVRLGQMQNSRTASSTTLDATFANFDAAMATADQMEALQRKFESDFWMKAAARIFGTGLEATPPR